ncbi:hypothetical protein TpMuguga_01g00001 [Theileria parva strain Muguga]|nr:uncharacterized protein TpMuguga_01g00001 [Theileria parva strain Muguga]EAN33245.1 hypothetical protein TpMuguga_01g00001 [Theileria parva strain Muguga]|eukprot:XP_765528.1 hypothetical protein [Theileria parva strain Muguga]
MNSVVTYSISSTSAKQITLDINKTTSTNDSDYSKNGKYRTFTAKPGKSFNKVVKKKLYIWECKNNDQAVKVVLMGSGNNKKHLLILLKSSNFVILYKTGRNKPWTNITSKRHDPTNLKFFDIDKELTSSDYEVTIYEFSYRFTFKAGVNCKRINYGDVVIWTHTDDKFEYITNFDLDLVKNEFFVFDDKRKSRKVNYEGPIISSVTPRTASASTPSTPKYQYASATKVTLDISKTQFTCFEYSLKSGVIRTFTPRSNCFIIKVTHCTTVIWESKTDVFGIRVTYVDVVKYLFLLLDNDKFLLFHQPPDRNKPWIDITYTRVNLSKLKFFAENDMELKSTDYSVNLVSYSYSLEFNAGVKCQKVKYGNEDVWTNSDDTDFGYIKSLLIDLVANKFRVKNDSGQLKKLDFKPSTPRLIPIPEQQYQQAPPQSRPTPTYPRPPIPARPPYPSHQLPVQPQPIHPGPQLSVRQPVRPPAYSEIQYDTPETPSYPPPPYSESQHDTPETPSYPPPPYSESQHDTPEPPSYPPPPYSESQHEAPQ